MKTSFMKKILILMLFCALITAIQPTFAMTTKIHSKSVQVEALSEFDTTKPAKTAHVKLLEDLTLPNDKIIKKNSIIYFDTNSVTDPKRLKQNATFTLKAKYYIDENSVKHEFTEETYAKYTTPIDKGAVAKTVALGAGSYFVKGLSTGVAVVEGAVKNEEGNRAKSAVVSAYESSPLSYIEKGEQIELKTGDEFYLRFYMPAYEIPESEEPNYEYTINGETVK